ncbi:hypothetical protein PCANC_28525 [Puccinia coronata f. sp. avenae]|uniref:Uncharacterized protein n=1 Tax=Puccinia coronata f. sp. avenae TaxID=200324 RepID=A0A2N5RTM1_9BASI|nr:hypothetical protein PCANC_28525 [Puccinia coronata f. sp. avenae]
MIPIPYDGEDKEVEDKDESTVNKQDLLTKEEDRKYRPLYERLVNHEKVKSIAHKYPSKASSNKGEKQVMAHITRINSELFTISNLYNLTYYVLAATRFPGEGSFCKELLNDPTWLRVVKDQWRSKETFEAYSQGRSIQCIVDCLQDPGTEDARSENGKLSDNIQSKLRHTLNKLLELFNARMMIKTVKDNEDDPDDEDDQDNEDNQGNKDNQDDEDVDN